MSSTKKNIIFQTVYQVLNTCLPLVTSPYLARSLGAEMQGVFSYTNSIVNYFSLFAMLGVVNYGTRTISKSLSTKDDVSDLFWNIYALQFIMSFGAFGCYCAYCVLFGTNYLLVDILQGLYLLSAWLDINWFYFGLGNFKFTIIRSTIIRVSTVVCILLFVKTPADLWIYTLLMGGSFFLSSFVLWFKLPRYVSLSFWRMVKVSEVISHLKPNILLFIPILAMSVYHVMDKTMLGILSTYKQVGFYYNADKVINIPIGIISGLGTVLLPKVSLLKETQEQASVMDYCERALELSISVSVAMCFGLAAISFEFTPLFFGAGFSPCIMLIVALAPVLIVKSLAIMMRMLYLIPYNKEKIFIQSVFLGAISNFIANILLIPHYGAMGAVISTFLAEFVACFWQLFLVRNEMNIKNILKETFIYVVCGMFMLVSIRISASFLGSGWLGLSLEIILGGFVYVLINIIYWYRKRPEMMHLVMEVVHRKK